VSGQPTRIVELRYPGTCDLSWTACPVTSSPSAPIPAYPDLLKAAYTQGGRCRPRKTHKWASRHAHAPHERPSRHDHPTDAVYWTFTVDFGAEPDGFPAVQCGDEHQVKAAAATPSTTTTAKAAASASQYVPAMPSKWSQKTSAAVRVRWVPVPTGCDHGCSARVSAVRAAVQMMSRSCPPNVNGGAGHGVGGPGQ